MDLQNAKEFFKSMGCSHFHMNKEEPELYKQYRSLNITTETEALWRQSEFDQLAEEIEKGVYKDMELWSQHAYLCELALRINKKRSFVKLLDVTNYLSTHLPKDKWVLVSERLNNRGIYDIKKGLIFHIYRYCGIEMAKEYLCYARRFCIYLEGVGMDYERCLESQEQCDVIEQKLVSKP